jgi:NADH:ubiquinone oxidoreductase subunit E
MTVTKEQIDKIIARYDANPRHALAVMQDMQDELGYVPREGLQAIARRFGRPMGELYALTTFYKALSLEPKGRHVVKICAGTTCHIRGGENIGDGIARELGIKPGETSADGEFSFEEVHCVGACALAPVVIVDDDLYGNVTLEKIPKIIGRYRASVPAGAGE